MKCAVIDRLREQIQHRLDQIMSEADRLRRALAALDPHRHPDRPGTIANKPAGHAPQARSGAPGAKASPTRAQAPGELER